MEFTRFAAAVILVFSSITSSNAATTPPSSGGGGDAQNMPCIQRLMPCQPYLHSVTPPPPASCCLPLKQIVETDVACLCSVFNDVDKLKALNLTKANALDLPKACGANADITKCKSISATTPPSSSTSPTTPMTPPASSTGNGTKGDDSAPSTAKTSNSAQVINFAGLSFVSAIISSTLFF